MSASRLDTARFTAGVSDVTIQPRLSLVRRPLLAMHSAGTGGDPSQFASAVLPALEKIAAALADDGFTVVCPSAVNLWGNGTVADEAGTAQGRAKDALTYARNTLGQSASAPVVLGASMGSLAALRYAALHSVACVVTFLTICDLTNVYVSDLTGFRSAIGTAYGVTYPTALPAGADPYRDHTAALSSVPMLCHYSSDDPYSTHITEFAAATGATLINGGALGHSDASIATVDVNQVRAFVAAHS